MTASASSPHDDDNSVESSSFASQLTTLRSIGDMLMYFVLSYGVVIENKYFHGIITPRIALHLLILLPVVQSASSAVSTRLMTRVIVDGVHEHSPAFWVFVAIIDALIIGFALMVPASAIMWLLGFPSAMYIVGNAGMLASIVTNSVIGCLLPLLLMGHYDVSQKLTLSVVLISDDTFGTLAFYLTVLVLTRVFDFT